MYKINRYINDFENIKEIKNLSLNSNPNAIHYLEKIEIRFIGIG
jgi:hypothetical protein